MKRNNKKDSNHSLKKSIIIKDKTGQALFKGGGPGGRGVMQCNKMDFLYDVLDVDEFCLKYSMSKLSRGQKLVLHKLSLA